MHDSPLPEVADVTDIERRSHAYALADQLLTAAANAGGNRRFSVTHERLLEVAGFLAGSPTVELDVSPALERFDDTVLDHYNAGDDGVEVRLFGYPVNLPGRIAAFVEASVLGRRDELVEALLADNAELARTTMPAFEDAASVTIHGDAYEVPKPVADALHANVEARNALELELSDLRTKAAGE